jgi:predicted Zn finger-like uncharacterized protein
MSNGHVVIIACPACATRYAVPDSAIGVDGRTVRCAKCRHSWFQDGPVLAQRPAPPPVAPPPSPAIVQPPVVQPAPPAGEFSDVAVAEAPVDDDPPPPPPFTETVEQPPVYSSGTIVPSYDEDRSSFGYEPPFRQRRNPAKLWMIGSILFAVAAFGGIGAVAWYGLPEWVPFARGTFAKGEPDLVLDFPPNRQDRRTLPNGAEFFGASGSITNVGKTRLSVPVVLITLRDGRERVVYSWEVVPSKRELAPGESVTINEAVTDVPKSAKFAEIGWKPS